MKRFLWIIMVCLSAVGWVSCGDWIESSDNGRLDGNWFLITIDTVGTGGSADVTADRKFLAVQGSLLVVRDADETVQYMFRFVHADGRLSLSDARMNAREHGDPLVTDVELLRPFGINSLTESFSVAFPNKNRMVLSGDMLRLTFKRY